MSSTASAGVLKPSEPSTSAAPIANPYKVRFHRLLPYIFLHVMALGAIFTGFSWAALVAALIAFYVRMFAITGFYHRYFSHRAYRTSRFWQFVFALVGNSAAQRGPLWWAAQHRHHHAHSDHEEDFHSAKLYGFYWSHIGWLTCEESQPTALKAVPDLARYPELRFLDRHEFLVPAIFALAVFGVGEALRALAPGLGTNGWQMLFWAFFVSTVVLFHCTCTINSLSHMFGRRRFHTTDMSRNNWALALLTLGEGWHNNHHHYPSSARQGFYWWEIDISYYILKLMSLVGIVRDLRRVPESILVEGRGMAAGT